MLAGFKLYCYRKTIYSASTSSSSSSSQSNNSSSSSHSTLVVVHHSPMHGQWHLSVTHLRCLNNLNRTNAAAPYASSLEWFLQACSTGQGLVSAQIVTSHCSAHAGAHVEVLLEDDELDELDEQCFLPLPFPCFPISAFFFFCSLHMCYKRRNKRREKIFFLMPDSYLFEASSR